MSLVMQYEPTEDSLTVYFEIPQLLVRNTIVKSRSNTFSVIIFAIILFIISFSEFAGIMDMLRRIFDGREGSGNYSMLTILMATMWDAALCITTFIEAFQSDESLILYILPAFILCLLFTNLELRLMLMIFQSRHQDANIREVICKFNLIAYGGLLLMYPILIYTNLSPLLFIGFSLIFLPQIYTNAVNGHRPDISSPYYTKFLSLRFLLVVNVTLLSSTCGVSPGTFSSSSPASSSSCFVSYLSPSKASCCGLRRITGPRRSSPSSCSLRFSTTGEMWTST